MTDFLLSKAKSCQNRAKFFFSCLPNLGVIEKKMPTANIQPITLSVTYMPAVLKHTAKSWHIEYYVLHPQKNQMVRQRVKLNKHRKHYSRLSDFKLFANEICNQMTVWR